MAVNAEYLELVVGNVLEFGDNISKLTADRLAFDLKEVFSDAESFAWTLGFAKNAIAKAYYEGSISAANVTYLSDTVCDAATKFTISWIEKNTPSHRQLVFDVCYLQLMIAEASARAQASKISSESNSVSASNGETASDNKAFLIPVHAAFAKKFANPYKRVVEQCLQEKDIVTFGKIAAASSVCDTITPLFKEVVEERGQYISYYSVDKNHLTLFFDQAANTITMHAETNANGKRVGNDMTTPTCEIDAFANQLRENTKFPRVLSNMFRQSSIRQLARDMDERLLLLSEYKIERLPPFVAEMALAARNRLELHKISGVQLWFDKNAL